jgi:hypothetical protein
MKIQGKKYSGGLPRIFILFLEMHLKALEVVEY